MTVTLLKSDHIARCPKHVLRPEHYSPDGTCQCVPPEGLNLRQKEVQAVASHQCPVCRVNPGDPCISQASSWAMKRTKRPHPERIQLVDSSLGGYEVYARKKRAFRSREVIAR